MVNNYWAKQAANQLQRKQEELQSTKAITPVKTSKNKKTAPTSKNRKTRYFLSTSKGGCGCGK